MERSSATLVAMRKKMNISVDTGGEATQDVG